jgi:hypothetical protein
MKSIKNELKNSPFLKNIRETSASLQYFKKEPYRFKNIDKQDLVHRVYPKLVSKSFTFSDKVVSEIQKIDEKREKFVQEIVHRKNAPEKKKSDPVLHFKEEAQEVTTIESINN